MKRLLSLLACGVLAAAFLAVADTVSVTATEGYKVYPFSLYTNPNSSVDLKMTPDGGYTISKNPGNSATVGNISFLVSDSVDSIDYEAMHYLYLNNLDTSAPIFVKATFVSNIYPVADTWGGTMVYDKGTVAVPEANSTIAIDLKTAMGDTWSPAGKVLCLQLWVQHDGDAAKKMNLRSIWLGGANADMTELSSADAIPLAGYEVQSGTLGEDPQHPDGFIFNYTAAAANVWKYTDVNLTQTPYAYIHVTGYTMANDVGLMSLYIAPPTADYPNGVGRNGSVNLRTDSLQGDSEYWLRFDLREYFPTALLEQETLEGVLFSAQPGAFPATLKIGGMYLGGQTFAATRHTVTLSAGEGGTITGPQTVIHGGLAEYTITPDQGYMLAALTLNGKMVAAPSTPYLMNVTRDINIRAVFLHKAAENRFNVRAFGTKGDGSDDSLCIQAALDYASSQGGGTVYIPKGTYGIAQPLRKPARVSLQGDGMWATTLVWKGEDGQAILNMANEALWGTTVSDMGFTKQTGCQEITGIRGGSTMEIYNSAIGTFKNLLFSQLDYGVKGDAEPTGVGIFDCYFENIFCSDCKYGLQLYGSGNTIVHPRMAGNQAGLVLDYLNGESFDGVHVIGGIFAANEVDILIPNRNGLRPCNFVGTWFETSSKGIVSIPTPGTQVMNLAFRDCMLNSNYSEGDALLDFSNATGQILLDNCTIYGGDRIVGPSGGQLTIR